MLEILTASEKNSMCNMENIDFIQKRWTQYCAEDKNLKQNE